MSGIIGHDPESPVTFERNTPPRFALDLSFAGLSCPTFTWGMPMPAKRSAMRKIKDVLRLKFEAKLSHERIAAATGISKGAVSKYVQRALQKGLAWPLPATPNPSAALAARTSTRRLWRCRSPPRSARGSASPRISGVEHL